MLFRSQSNFPPERLAAIYDRIGWNTWRSIFKMDVIEQIKHYTRPHILDVGCFRGDFLRILLNENFIFRYTGVDVTPRYIEYAKKEFNGEYLSDYIFKVGSVFNLEEQDNFYDLTILSDVLHHLPEIVRPQIGRAHV